MSAGAQAVLERIECLSLPIARLSAAVYTRSVLDRFSSRIFLGHAQRRLFLQGIPVLVYHGIQSVPPAACDPFLYVKPAKFDAQLGALRGTGFQSATLDEIGVSGSDLSKKIVITFDDGRTSVFENAMEPLARHGFRAIQFIVADRVGRTNEWDTVHGHVAEPLMDAVQIREWLAAGHEIGSHSMTHRNLTKLTETDARGQIFDSRKRLEDQFGIEVRHFCYPHGKWNERVRDLVAEAGYSTACTTRFGVNTTTTPRFQLSRIPALTGQELIMKTADRLRKKLGI